MKALILPIVLLVQLPLFAQVSAPFVVDFNNHAVGSYTTAMAKQDFPPPVSGSSWYHGMDQGRSEIVDEDGNKVLRVKYPAGCVGPNDEPVGCAIQIKWPLPESADTMWATYRLKFEPGFEFVKGGKLPGFCGGKCYTGGNFPDGGDGWSARIMWRTGGAVVQYVYFADQTSQYGDDMKWDLTGTQKVFVPGSWDTVTTQIILNTVPSGTNKGEKNGIIRSWFNGELSMDVDTLRLVDYENQAIDLFYISTFHGGSDNTWAPIEDSYVRYDDFRISVTPPSEIGDNTDPDDGPVYAIRSETLQTNWTPHWQRNKLSFFQALPENATLKLRNSKGREVWSVYLRSGQDFAISPVLPPGIYHWQLAGKNLKASGILTNANFY